MRRGGESSGHLSFPLEPMTTVDGRPMLAALQMLLGPDRLFEAGSSATRLKPLMVASRKEQNEVSTRLAEQVLEALWILVKGFDAAGAPQAEPQHMLVNNEGLTTSYNRFHDLAETDPRIAELRRLHSEMDQAVLNAYG